VRLALRRAERKASEPSLKAAMETVKENERKSNILRKLWGKCGLCLNGQGGLGMSLARVTKVPRNAKTKADNFGQFELNHSSLRPTFLCCLFLFPRRFT